MTSDEKPQLLFHAKYLWKAPHCHFQGRGKNNNPSAVLHIHFRMQQKTHTLFAENNKNTGLCQRDGKFDGFLQAVLTTPFDSLLYTRKNQSSAANWLVNADKYLHKGGSLVVSISLVCHKDWTDWTNFPDFSPPLFLEELRGKNKNIIIKIQGVQITNGVHNTTSNFLYQRVLSSEEFKALEAITNLRQA